MEFKIIPERDLIWLAGLIDGEGSIYIRKQTGGKNNIHTLDLEIAMVDKPTIERVYKIFELGSFRPCKRKQKNVKHRQAWKVSYTSSQAEKVLGLIIPYLYTKKDEGLLALEFFELKRNRVGRAGLSEEMVEKREGYYREMKELKLKEWEIEE